MNYKNYNNYIDYTGQCYPVLDSSYDVSLQVDGADLYFVNTTDYGSDGFVFHTYNLSQPYRPVLVSVYPTSVNQSLNVYVQFDENPTADVYEHHVQAHTSYSIVDKPNQFQGQL